MILTEVTRNQHIRKTLQSDKYSGKNPNPSNRYNAKSDGIKIKNSTELLNKLDMDKLFRNNILDVDLEISGKTNNYIVRVSFENILKYLHDRVKSDENKFTLSAVTLALISAFDSDDLNVRCTCPDFIYRLAFYLSMNGGIAGEPETRPSTKTNPNDTKGSGCKHIQAVLSSTVWVQRIARCIYKYVEYLKEHNNDIYLLYIYPALFEKDYDEAHTSKVDLELDDSGDDTTNDNTDLVVDLDN